jgi:flagellar hook assembly protein FlgD
MKGDYQFQIEINPDRDQKEQNTYNNLGLKNFRVKIEDINPILDVSFDGLRIMDGDFVSSNPAILVSLKDENPYLKIDDPSSFEIKLQYPNEDQPRIIDQNSNFYSFVPATDLKPNEASVVLNPILEDGDYQLIISAKDASNNTSGKEDYVVDFRVLSKKTITEVFNYPNPFSTSTQFVFTLTGEVPDQFSIQIMTVTGKVVKEILKEELGLLKIGNNITEYKWDGTDEFGNRLGNGTYFYRVLMSNSGEYESVNTASSGSFKKGFGKLVILR